MITFSHYVKHMEMKYTFIGNQTLPIRSACIYGPNFNRIVWECIRSAITYWLTVPVCIICNIIIIQSLYQASRIERSLSGSLTDTLNLSSRQLQLTGMLVTSSVCFILTATPSTIHSIYLSITKNMNKNQYVVHVLTNILLHFHHASNFLAFVFSCLRFRLELIEFFRKVFCARFYEKWYKRSAATTEHMYVYSTKQPKTPVRLFSPKANSRKRNNPNDIVVIAMNNLNTTKTGRNLGHRQTIQK